MADESEKTNVKEIARSLEKKIDRESILNLKYSEQNYNMQKENMLFSKSSRDKQEDNQPKDGN